MASWPSHLHRCESYCTLFQAICPHDYDIVPDCVAKCAGLPFHTGFSATAEIVLEKKDSVLAIAEKDLIFEKDTFYAEVVDKNMKTEKKAVKTGISDGINIEILDGLTPEDNVMTH